MNDTPLLNPLNRRRKTYEEVADQIRDLILKGRVKIFEKLPSERVMAEQLGVSRVTVREAVRTLELTGFVTVKEGARGGVFVAQDYDRPLINSIRNMVAGGDVSIAGLFTVRRVIEPHAAARLAAHGTDDERGELTEVVRKAEEEAARGTSIRSYNFRFHRMIVRMCGNAILAAVGETVLTVLIDHMRDVASPEISATQLEFHKTLLAAILDGDAERSRRIMLADIRSLESAVGEEARPSPRTRPPPPEKGV